MTKYYPYGVSLSKGQLEKLSRAYNNNSAITIRLARNELSGPHELMLTKTQINKLRKAMSQGTESDIKISKTQIRKAEKIAQLIAYKHLLSTGQKRDILNALQTGNGLVIRPTKTQQGGFLGTLLASIGVPLLLNALTGKGMQADRTGSANTASVYVP
ncbi:unnamed protein product, partial [Porites evermanni]